MSTLARFPVQLQEAIVARLGWSSLRPVQNEAGAAILDGKNAVVLAPTAGGKTEAAVFPILANLIARPADGVAAVYVAPIKALLNNQEERLGTYTEMVGLRRFVWHGDTKQSAKRTFTKEPDELLMTTPESLEVMLLSPRVPVSRLFGDLRYVVIDEVHALAGTDRGAHLMSVIERLLRCTKNDVQRIGLSATVGNPEAILGWLQGTSERPGIVINPPSEPQRRHVAVLWRPTILEIARDAAERAAKHKSLFFCQSRSLTESVAEQMRRAGTDVFVHHSSVSLEERQAAEERFHHGADVAIACTSTLELGIDVGDLDLVFQANATNSVSSFLQRMGRTGRRASQLANTTFFCEEPDSVLQSIALVELAREGWVESVRTQNRCWPVFVHQLMAMTLQFGGVSRERCWEQLSRVPDFRGIKRPEFDRAVGFMVENEYLFETGGLLSLGSEAERVYGRKNFGELYAVFSSPVLYTVHSDAGKPIGSLEQDFVDRLVEEMSSFLLGGRAWTVDAINHHERTIGVRPAPSGKKPSWGGMVPQMLGFELCQKIKHVLIEEASYPYLDERAAGALAEYRADLGPLLRDSQYAVQLDDDAGRWWTFAGGRINYTLRSAINYAAGWKVVPDNLQLRIEGDGVSHTAIRDVIQYISERSFWEDVTIWRSILASLPEYRLSKFQRALPQQYSRETVARHLLDMDGALEFLQATAERRAPRTGFEDKPPPELVEVTPQPPLPSPAPRSKPLEVFGDYELLRKLTGGMAESFVARHTPTGDPVFVKRVLETGREDQSALQRELQIYQRLQRLQCDAVLGVRDIIRADGYLAFVTEFADGGDLADHVEAQPGGRLPTKEVQAIGLAIADALLALHASQIVHRDLKPENVLQSNGAWKLTDFGIAKNLIRLQTMHTFQQAGTPGYTAPEQFEGVEAHASADVYSFGKVLTFMLTGQTDPDQVSYPSWAKLIRGCAESDPAGRPSMDEIRERLSAIPT